MFEEFGFRNDDRNNAVIEEDAVSVERWEDINDSDDEETIQRNRQLFVQRWAENEEANGENSDSGENEAISESEENISVRCSCKEECLKTFNKVDIQEHIYSLKEVEKSENELLVMAILQRYRNEETRKGKRRRARYRYMYGGKQVCKEVFCYVNDIGKKTLKALIKHVNTNGVVPRIHKNTARKPHNALKYEEVKFCVDFLVAHLDLHGMPMPAAPRGHDEAPPVYLPSHLTKKDIHEEYCRACDEASIRKLGLSSFKGVWKNCTPHIKIVPPQEDVCHRCQLFKKQISDAVTEPEKIESTTALRNHAEVRLHNIILHAV